MGLGTDAGRADRRARAGPRVRAGGAVAQPLAWRLGGWRGDLVSPMRRRIASAVIGLTFIAVVAATTVPQAGGAVVGGPGGSGIDTSLPDTDSAVDVSG